MPDTAPAAPNPAIQIQDVLIARGNDRLLDSLSFSLSARGTTAIMGPNGSGKSLTLRVIAGLVRPDSGSISFPVGRPLARDLALVFQKPVLLRRTVRANLDHAFATYGVPRPARRQRIDDLLSLAHLSDLAERPARALSGGEQQRLALVRALGADPKFLLLDEPTASLDPQATAQIEALISRAADQGICVVLVTHDQGQVRRLADEVIFFNRGQVVESGSAPAFLDAPYTPEAKAYLAGELLI